MTARIADHLEKRVVALYAQGFLSREIAAQVGCSKTTVLAVLQRYGISPRAACPRRRYAIDESAFCRVDADPVARYWLGMLLTDGRVYAPTPSSVKKDWALSLGLAEEDRAHVEAFRAFLGSDKPIHRAERKDWKIMGRPTRAQALLTCSVSSRRLVEAVLSYGIVPRKTWTAHVVPALADCPHFWRGCVDGDGTLCWHRAGRWVYPDVRLIGTESVCESFAAFCRALVPTTRARVGRIQPGRTTFDFGLNGAGAFAVIHAMYGIGGPALARKAALAGEMMGTAGGKRLWRDESGNTIPRRPYCYSGPSPGRLFTAEQDRQIRAEYEAGASVNKLAAKWGGTGRPIVRAICRAGGRTRTIKEARQLRLPSAPP